MKKVLLIFLLLLVSAFSAYAESDLDIRLVEYDPDPVEPGEKFIATFEIEKITIGTQTYEVRLIEHDPFLLRTIGIELVTLGLGDNEELRYRFDVDSDADESKGIITLAYREEGQTSWIKKDFEIDIDNGRSLKVSSVSSNPSVISKGESAELKITLENDGNIDLEDIKVELDLSGVPLAPYNSIAYSEITRLDEGNSKTVYFNIIALDNADSGIYKIPIIIEYEDDDGNDFLEESFVSVRIGAVPELEVLSESDYVISGDRNFVDVKFVNKGDGNIQFLDVELYEDTDYNILGVNKVYVGQIDSDDYESLTFDIFVNSNDLELKLFVQYKDDSGEEYSKLFSVPVNTYTQEEAQQLNLKQPNYIFVWVIVGLVVIIAFFLIRRFRKRRQKEE